MNQKTPTPAALRVVIFLIIYIAMIVFVYGYTDLLERPLLLLWPLVAVVDVVRFLISIAHWSNETITNGIGAVLLVYFAVSMVRFLLGRVRLVNLLGIALGLIFIYAAAPKILEVENFARDIRNYRILPAWSYNLLALWLPWIELVAGLCLIFNVWKKGGIIVIMGLLVVFLAAVISAVIRGLDIDCGCFGNTARELARAHRIGMQKIFENLAMFVIAILLLLPSKHRKPLHH